MRREVARDEKGPLRVGVRVSAVPHVGAEVPELIRVEVEVAEAPVLRVAEIAALLRAPHRPWLLVVLTPKLRVTR